MKKISIEKATDGVYLFASTIICCS